MKLEKIIKVILHVQFSTFTPCTLHKQVQLAILGILMNFYQWHLDDPVDQWEMQRNDRTEERQGNRNPYIDHPELVGRAWGFVVIPSVSFTTTSGSIDEGNSGTTTYQVTVSASSAPTDDITLDIAIDGSSTATSSTDYTLSTTSLTLTNSDFSKTVSISVVGDTDFESDETVVLKIQNLSSNASLGDDTHTLTIENDDSDCAVPNTAASNLAQSNVLSSSASISWTNGNGANRLVLVKETSDFVNGDMPVDGQSYSASSAFGAGDAIGGAFVVF